MRTKVRNLGLAVMITAGFGFTACEKEDPVSRGDSFDAPVGNSIVDIASETPEFSTLVQALKMTGLDNALDGTSTLTVFAPTNEAFDIFFAGNGYSGLNDVNMRDLTEILQYHVTRGDLPSRFLDGYYPSLLQNKSGNSVSLYFDADDESSFFNLTDIGAGNGIIHGIDKVLTPPTITDLAIANEDFSILVDAVIKADLAGLLATENADFTVFAPTNEAFGKLLQKLDISGLNDLGNETLTDVLLYHTLGQEVPAANVMSGYVSSNATAFGSKLSIQISTTQGVQLNNMANVVLTDVTAVNGTVHVIDEVILPQNMVEIVSNNANFSILRDALVRADLTGMFSESNPYTVFAPTNEAFEQLFEQLDISGIEALDIPTLTAVLSAHVVEGNVLSDDLVTGDVPTLNVNKNLAIDTKGGVTIDNDINVVLADVQTTMGVVHVIDRIILPAK